MKSICERTSGGTPHDDASDAIVYPSESTRLVEAPIRLKTCLYGVYRVEQKVNGCACEAACLEYVRGECDRTHEGGRRTLVVR